ncbi:MAG TPA: polyprenyl synthetase family protein [Actinophytocola sp.]|uniref:polyprenyl synthetase family protein n=1 Tax=Actinophytocola sp. TaxID=1872138 RepID=UPI002DB9EC32|nr:polyprenyl synthetase family protein [Actinophytocola sp.]HEU5473310.1 polyprenyl synthetase family protein [Actinophytocola sp.]
MTPHAPSAAVPRVGTNDLPGPRSRMDLAVPVSVERLLREFLDDKAADLDGVDPELRTLVATARDAVLGGGKRLRPMFGYWGWRGVVGLGPPAAPVLPALAALELLHAFALVHDDVMDDSPTRRGRPSAHAALRAWHRDRGLTGDGTGFGRSAAILTGDLCLVWADELIASAGLPAETVLAARRVYDRMRVDAIYGQFLDLLGEVFPGWTLDRAELVARLKTACYTVAGPLLYGAALAGCPDPILETAYARYGMALGEAFQLRDDLLDVYGDPAVTGKPAGTDLRRGKPTPLLELARELADRRQRCELERELARGAQADVARLGRLIRCTGAVERMETMIDDRVVAANGALSGAVVDPDTRAALARLAAAATVRSA